jgi:hypothetical protein
MTSLPNIERTNQIVFAMSIRNSGPERVELVSFFPKVPVGASLFKSIDLVDNNIEARNALVRQLN